MMEDVAYDEREKNLPKWAQARMSTYRHLIGALKVRNKQLRGDIPNTRVHRRDWGGDGDVPLPPDSKIVFTMDSARRRGSDVMIYIDLDGRLTVQADSAVLITPQASNAFNIQIRD